MTGLGRVRDDFPQLARTVRGKRLVYLDSSSTSQRPRQVLQAMDEFSTQHNANVHRGIYTLSEEATAAYEEAHAAVGRFIGAAPEEVVFTKNTTESLNLLAYTLTRHLQKGDEILVTQMEHHSNFVPWQQLAKQRGLVFKAIRVTPDGELDPRDFALVGPRTKVVAVTHMSNVLGTINPIPELADLAHEHGALCVVDAAQSVPHFPVNVRRLGCDFLAFSGHKMLGPTGIGVLFGRRQLLESLDPFLYGGGMIREVTTADTTWNDLPWKFEAGTPPIAEGVGLAAAVRYLERLGMDQVAAHERSLLSYALEQLEGLVTVHGRPRERGGVISFSVPGVHPHDLVTLLDQDGIAVRGGNHCAMPLMAVLGVPGTTRASLYVYNTEEDIDALADGIRKARKVFA